MISFKILKLSSVIYPLSKPFRSFLANEQNSPNVMYAGEPLLAHFIAHCIISVTESSEEAGKKNIMCG